MRTKQEIFSVAYEQLAKDLNCNPEDFLGQKAIFTENTPREGWRSFDKEPPFLNVAVTANVTVFSANPTLLPWLREEFGEVSSAFQLTIPRLHALEQALQIHGESLADMHHYLLPKDDLTPPQRDEALEWYEGKEIERFRGDTRFGEAIIFSETAPDQIAVVAREGDEILGMAGCSADGENLWQIGINVVPEHRGKGIATRLVKELKNEVLRRGKVPYYGSVSSHIKSQTIAIHAGFVPAWVSLYSRPIEQKKT